MAELSLGTKLVWKIGAVEAAAKKQRYIQKEHIFIGLCKAHDLLNAEIIPNEVTNETATKMRPEIDLLDDCFRRISLDPVKLRRRLRERIPCGRYERNGSVIHRSEECKRCFQGAELISSIYGYSEVESLHLLWSILEAPGEFIPRIFVECGVTVSDFKQVILFLLETGSRKQILGDEDLGFDMNRFSANSSSHKEIRSTHFLDRYGRDLTDLASLKKLGPFSGRHKEMQEIIWTLARKTKNNPILIGEAGVGKTAVVEALAVNIAQGKSLAGKRIIQLDLAQMVAGTIYRGQFEERLTNFLKEAATNPEVIVFIDEIHNLVGAGSAEGSMDAANILKPALARGELVCIGATTIGEYRQYIEKDPALARRFQAVMINEPSPSETLVILQGLRVSYERHHKVKISDEAIKAAVDLSVRFITERQLPDKALDLLDEASSRASQPVLTTVPVRRFKYSANRSQVDTKLIADVVAEKTGIEVARLTENEGKRLLELEEQLRSRVIGQDEAIKKISERLRIARTKATVSRGPLGVFLFLGPTGVGKTELARSLAFALFGSEKDLIRIDMSEYQEKHSVSKLIGAPPGYIGHQNEGQLTGKLRTKPYSVVLLDEIEKAHPEVFDVFLQVFDEARITDSKGRTVDARNAIFIMTSNISANKQTRQIGFQSTGTPDVAHEVLSIVRDRFRPEFINRIDEQIVFKPLCEKDLRKITRLVLQEMVQNIKKEHNLDLIISSDVESYLAQSGYDPIYGARHLRRRIEHLIAEPLSRIILEKKLSSEKTIHIFKGKNGLRMETMEVDQDYNRTQ